MKEIIIKGLNETVYEDICDNGLKVYMWVNPKVKSTFMSLSVKYGSVDTEFVVNKEKIIVPDGTAHFLEHIKFNKPDGSTAHDFYYQNGAEVNAFTTFEYTSYHVYAMNNIEKNLVHLLDFVQEPFFNKEMIEKEKGIILEEEKMGEDDPDTLNYFGIFKTLFENCKYKNLVTGNQEDIKKISLNDIENVYNNFYHPENMFMVITGNFNPYEMMQIIKENQNKKSFDKYTNPKVVKSKENVKPYNDYKEIECNITSPRVKIGFKIPRNKFENFSDLELRLYSGMLLTMNFGSTSYFKDFLLENKLATYINSMTDIYDDYFVLIVSFESRFYNEVIKLVLEKLNNLEISKETLIRKKRAKLATLILGYDDIESVNYKLQDYIINYNQIIDNIKECHENVSIKKLEMFKEKLNFKNPSIHVMKPKENTTK